MAREQIAELKEHLQGSGISTWLYMGGQFLALACIGLYGKKWFSYVEFEVVWEEKRSGYAGLAR